MKNVTQGPNIVHPEKASAVGSRNSLNRDSRDEYKEAKLIVDEEVDKVLNHLNSKLPPEVLNKLNITSTVKELLHTYFNQGMQSMLNRYLTTVEDEMAKKFRDMVDNEETRGVNFYTPIGVPKLLNDIGGEDKFNTAEVEKSVINIYGHLQGHVQRGQFELEQDTNNILRQRSDVGAFIRGENVHSIIKCCFVDSILKPETVTEMSLSINILDSELVSPIYHYLTSVDYIVGQLVSQQMIEYIDEEVEKLGSNLLDQGKEAMTNNEIIFEKIKFMGNAVRTDVKEEDLPEEIRDSNARSIFLLGQKLVKIVEGVPSDVSKLYSNPLKVKNNITRLLNEDYIRNRGFSTAVNTITAILDTSRMGYQYIESNKNARQLILREYEETENLPDEHYVINMKYLDADQLREIRIAYFQRLDDYKAKAERILDLCEALYRETKANNNFVDYDDIKEEYLYKKEKTFFQKLMSAMGAKGDSEESNEPERVWDEIIFIEPRETDIEKATPTFVNKLKRINSSIAIAEKRLKEIFQKNYPVERICIEEKIHDLKEIFSDFCRNYNPFHCQPGLNMQVDITTIKRKKTTMKSMSNVLNEFLYSVSKEFQDTAFADFTRRRSTDTTGLYEGFIDASDS